MTTAAPTKPGLLINRNFASLWVGQTISLIGDQVFQFTLIVWIAGVIAAQPDGTIAPWAPLAVSGALVAATLPIFLVGPLAGVFVDRSDKRAMMLRMDATRALLILLLLVTVPQPWLGSRKEPLLAVLAPALADHAGHLVVGVHLGILYAIVALASTCAQFFNPARLALIGDVVPEAARGQASGLAQSTQALALIVGPPLASPLLFAFGVHWALIINALSFLASFVCVGLVAAPPAARSVVAGQRAHVIQEFFAGLRFAFANRIISTVLGVSFLVTLGTGAFDALIAFFVVQNLHTPVANLGYLAGVFGAGAIVGALAGALLLRSVNPARLLVLSLLVGGVVFALFARSTTLVMGVALTLLVGILFSVVNVPISPLVIGATPRELLGRVGAVITPVVSAAQLMSIALSGYLASTVVAGLHARVLGIAVGPIDTIFTGTALLILLAGVFAAARLWTYQSPAAPGDIAA